MRVADLLDMPSSPHDAVAAPACAPPSLLKVARTHARDWAALLLLAAVEVGLNVIQPFHRFVGADMLTDLRYPLKSNTVPVWAVPIYAVIGPMVIFTFFFARKRNVYDLHHAILGILFAVFITGVLTDAIKDAVGRPRPDFFWRCFPDGKAVFDKITTEVICHGIPSVVKEGYKSFPSGHSSWSFSGLGFLSWYLAGKLTLFDRRGHIAKLCIVLMPLLIAVMIAISRVDDYWHHWQDVFAGAVLGMVVAAACYRQFFPLPSDEKGCWPHAHFRFLAEQEHEDQTPRFAEMSHHTSASASVSDHGQMSRQTSQALDEMEAGTGNQRDSKGA